MNAAPLATTERVAVDVVGLTKVFANGAGVRDVTFGVPEHAVTAVIGPNGSGKTVVFSLIAGLLRPDGGHIGIRPGSRVAYCPDVAQFEPWLTAEEVVETSVSLARPPRPLGVRGVLDACGLAKVARRRVAEFSRGMLQRLGIAAALVLDPDLLILDEPSSALDPIGRADVRTLIRAQRADRSVMLSSHSLSEVEQISDTVVVLDEGRVVEHGTTSAILSRGLTPTWTIRFATDAPVDEHAVRRAASDATLTPLSPGVASISFPSFGTAEQQLNAAVSALDVPILEITLVDRDLDAAFARIVKANTQR